MPRTTRTKHTSLVEKRARAVCAGLAKTESEPMQWRKVRLMARSVAFDHETADAAICYAIKKGWLIGVGEPPHSVCLTDDGRVGFKPAAAAKRQGNKAPSRDRAPKAKAPQEN
jgi:hypothetical protein